ncbi:hypothetical protein, partial [Brevundimonas aurantiaca]|uniref:hypothetical protein n=1 Tax=Brevundimonas aurantiaca TaxID=74316 RepID=UPI001D1830B6
MTDADDPEDTDDKRLCVQCIGDEFLTAEILKTGQTAVCGYCGKTDKTETADSDDAASLFRFDAARHSGVIAPPW